MYYKTACSRYLSLCVCVCVHINSIVCHGAQTACWFVHPHRWQCRALRCGSEGIQLGVGHIHSVLGLIKSKAVQQTSRVENKNQRSERSVTNFNRSTSLHYGSLHHIVGLCTKNKRGFVKRIDDQQGHTPARGEVERVFVLY